MQKMFVFPRCEQLPLMLMYKEGTQKNRDLLLTMDKFNRNAFKVFKPNDICMQETLLLDTTKSAGLSFTQLHNINISLQLRHS